MIALLKWRHWLMLCILFAFEPAHARVLLITSGHQIAYQEVVTAITHQITEPFPDFYGRTQPGAQ